MDNLPKLCEKENNFSGKIIWDYITDQKRKVHYDRTAESLGELAIPVKSLCCNNSNCNNKTHKCEIDFF